MDAKNHLIHATIKVVGAMKLISCTSPLEMLFPADFMVEIQLIIEMVMEMTGISQLI